MTGILGPGTSPGILGGAAPQAMSGGGMGLLSLLQQQQQPAPAYSPGATIWREIMQAMAGGGNPLAFMDPSKAGQFFSPTSQAYLPSQYQAAKKGK